MTPSSRQTSPPRRWIHVAVGVALLGSVSWYTVRELSSRRASEHADRALAALASGDRETAERELREARRLGSNPRVLRASGTLLLARGQLEPARAQLLRVAESAPREPHALCLLAEAELRSGDLALLDRAAEDGFRAATLEPSCARALQTAAEALIAKGDTRRGIDALEQAWRLQPGNLRLGLALHQQLLGAQRLPEATALARDLTRRFPREAQTFAVLGLCYQLYPAGAPDAREAVRVLRHALSLDSRNLVAHAQLGHHYLLRGDTPAAIRHLEIARMLAPDRGSVLFDLSRAYRLAGRRREADAALGRFRALSARQAEIAHLRRRRLVDPDDPDLSRRLAALTRAGGEAPGRGASAPAPIVSGAGGDPPR